MLSTHLVVGPAADIDTLIRIKKDVGGITDQMDLAHSTIELELGDDCSIPIDCHEGGNQRTGN